MKTLKLLNVTVTLASILFASTAFSQDAKTLNELLDMIESSAISETAEARKREADFVRDQRRQSQLLKQARDCLLYTSPSPRDISGSRMPSSA